MVDLGDFEEPEPSGHKDFIGLDYHGKAVSHLDALCHIGYRGQLFGGVASRDVFSSRGSTWAAVTTLADGLVLRGVLLDLPVVHGVDWVEPGTGVPRRDVEDGLEERWVFDVGPGDAVLLRSGWRPRAALGAWNTERPAPACTSTPCRCSPSARMSLLGGDSDSDVRPSPVEGVHSPIHALSLTALGIPLLDNLDLEELVGRLCVRPAGTSSSSSSPLWSSPAAPARRSTRSRCCDRGATGSGSPTTCTPPADRVVLGRHRPGSARGARRRRVGLPAAGRRGADRRAASRATTPCCSPRRRSPPRPCRAPDQPRLLARFGVGLDAVDVGACTAAGVAVTITPDGARRAVATAALTLILAVASTI